MVVMMVMDFFNSVDDVDEKINYHDIKYLKKDENNV